MVKWFGRHDAPPQEVVDMPEQAAFDMQPIDPHAFVAEQEALLASSADAWRNIAQKSKEREEGYTEHIRQGLIDVWVANSNGAPLPEDRILDRDTEKLATDLSVYSLMAARHFSSSGLKYGLQNQIKDHFLHIPDHTVNYIIRSPGFPSKRFLIRQVWLANEMAAADGKSGAVLTNLTRTYSDRPDDISALAGLYEGGVDEVDGRYAELKEIIATDWHRPDSEQSVLRWFCNNLRNEPRTYAAEFSKLVSEGDRGQRWASVRGMARFAIIAAGGDPEDPVAIESMLQRTYSRWDEVQDIDTLFKAFVASKVEAIESHFNLIAGSKMAKNIRAYPSAEQVANFKDFFKAQYTPDRRSRRKAARAAIRTYGADRLPTAESIDRVAGTESILEKKPRNIKVSMNSGSGTSLEDVSPDDVPKMFKIGEEGFLAEDVRKMVAWLQLNPISPASERIKSEVGARINYNGNMLKLWRFAPNRAPEVEVRNGNKYWRIVYGLTKDGIIITDILDHDAFDKKYK